MKNLTTFAALLLLAGVTAHGQTIISDTFNVANVGSGFLLGEGVNSGINPPTTRLTGTAAPNLRYMSRTGRDVTSYYITTAANGRLRANTGLQAGRVTLSADGVSPFDFGSALGIPFATVANPVVYDIKISMDNNDSGTRRVSLGLGTVETDANNWDFGIQLYNSGGQAVARRVDAGSSGTTDLDTTVWTGGTAGAELDFLVRVTDAGAETSTFNSRVQVSLDNGGNWIYDTDDDALLPSGWRLNGGGRFFSLDFAGNNSSFVTYDKFSVSVITPAVPEPSSLALGLVAGLCGLIWRRR